MSIDYQAVNRDLGICCPFFVERLQKGLAAAQAAGHKIDIFEAWRPPDRQTKLYAQGRTEPGNKITWVTAWHSLHQYGLGADIVGHAEGKWDWDVDYSKFMHHFTEAGLELIGANDPGHVQLTGGLKTEEMRTINEAHGMPAVWAEVRARLK